MSEDSDVADAFDDFDRSWAESHGVFERRTIQRELELVVMPGWQSVAPDVARRRGVPVSVSPMIRAVPAHPRGPHHVWRWEWSEVEFVSVGQRTGRPGRFGALLDRWIEATYSWDRRDWTIAAVAVYVVAMTLGILMWRLFG
jgi:hypothetical protein